jgi:hypothetical protein
MSDRLLTETVQSPMAHAPGRVWLDQRETVTVGRVLYGREGYMIDGQVTSDYLVRHFSRVTIYDDNNHEIEDVTDSPEVLCGDCLGSAFTIRYGSYECLARCVACGKQACVYSG